jgi:AcrR family transcriptional regulator
VSRPPTGGTTVAGADAQGVRARATQRRRSEILDAALQCFSAVGYDRTTLADIRTRAGASTGSIYHHFGSKEQIAVSLYIEGVRSTQEHGLESLLRTRSARTGIAALVGAYVDWVVDNPSWATFLFAMRHAPFLADGEGQIGALNADVEARAAGWIADRVRAGELPDLDPGMRVALIFGPCRHWAGAWLRGATATEPQEAKRLLSRAILASLASLI